MPPLCLLLLLISVIATTAQRILNLDCSTCPQACNNDCYAVYSQGRPSMLNYDHAPLRIKKSRRKRACGCPSPCGTQGMAPFNLGGAGNECDEYPPASTTQGGLRGSSVLRCIPSGDNGDEGHQFQNLYGAKAPGGCANAACQFTVMFTNYQNSPLCAGLMAHPNDGFEFHRRPLRMKGWTAWKRDSIQEDGEQWDVAQPTHPNGTFPSHMRREFLLSNGERAVWLSTNTNYQFPLNQTVIQGRDGTETMLVRELLGAEKSGHLRPVL